MRMRWTAVAFSLLGLAACHTHTGTRTEEGTLSVDDILELYRADVNEWHIEVELREKGMQHPPTPDECSALREAGASGALISAMALPWHRPPPRPARAASVVTYRETRCALGAHGSTDLRGAGELLGTLLRLLCCR